jgi:hypothetical protein
VFTREGDFVRRWIWRPLVIPSSFSSPSFVAVVGDGVFVSGGTSIIGGGERLRLFDRDGTLLRSWVDRLQQARGVAVVGTTIYLASDSSVLIIDSHGELQAGFPGFTGGQFFIPMGLTFQANQVYVTDSANHRVLVFDAR